MAELMDVDTQTEQPQAQLCLIGQLLARMVRRAVEEGRAWVDESGVAHPLDDGRANLVELRLPQESLPKEDRDAA